uniref:Uncharacterized protein n=1 Tax=Sphaerodactylus townsendi TaxID=933632 RepID=A0ACB8EF28_9SAUR
MGRRNSSCLFDTPCDTHPPPGKPAPLQASTLGDLESAGSGIIRNMSSSGWTGIYLLCSLPQFLQTGLANFTSLSLHPSGMRISGQHQHVFMGCHLSGGCYLGD